MVKTWGARFESAYAQVNSETNVDIYLHPSIERGNIDRDIVQSRDTTRTIAWGRISSMLSRSQLCAGTTSQGFLLFVDGNSIIKADIDSERARDRRDGWIQLAS